MTIRYVLGSIDEAYKPEPEYFYLSIAPRGTRAVQAVMFKVRQWDPKLHPRDHRGMFIDTPDKVPARQAHRGDVVVSQAGQPFRIRSKQDGKVEAELVDKDTGTVTNNRVILPPDVEVAVFDSAPRIGEQRKLSTLRAGVYVAFPNGRRFVILEADSDAETRVVVDPGSSNRMVLAEVNDQGEVLEGSYFIHKAGYPSDLNKMVVVSPPVVGKIHPSVVLEAETVRYAHVSPVETVARALAEKRDNVPRSLIPTVAENVSNGFLRSRVRTGSDSIGRPSHSTWVDDLVDSQENGSLSTYVEEPGYATKLVESATSELVEVGRNATAQTRDNNLANEDERDEYLRKHAPNFHDALSNLAMAKFMERYDPSEIEQAYDEVAAMRLPSKADAEAMLKLKIGSVVTRIDDEIRTEIMEMLDESEDSEAFYAMMPSSWTEGLPKYHRSIRRLFLQGDDPIWADGRADYYQAFADFTSKPQRGVVEPYSMESRLVALFRGLRDSDLSPERLDSIRNFLPEESKDSGSIYDAPLGNLAALAGADLTDAEIAVLARRTVEAVRAAESDASRLEMDPELNSMERYRAWLEFFEAEFIESLTRKLDAEDPERLTPHVEAIRSVVRDLQPQLLLSRNADDRLIIFGITGGGSYGAYVKSLIKAETARRDPDWDVLALLFALDYHLLNNRSFRPEDVEAVIEAAASDNVPTLDEFAEQFPFYNPTDAFAVTDKAVENAKARVEAHKQKNKLIATGRPKTFSQWRREWIMENLSEYVESGLVTPDGYLVKEGSDEAVVLSADDGAYYAWFTELMKASSDGLRDRNGHMMLDADSLELRPGAAVELVDEVTIRLTVIGEPATELRVGDRDSSLGVEIGQVSPGVTATVGEPTLDSTRLGLVPITVLPDGATQTMEIFVESKDLRHLDRGSPTLNQDPRTRSTPLREQFEKDATAYEQQVADWDFLVSNGLTMMDMDTANLDDLEDVPKMYPAGVSNTTNIEISETQLEGPGFVDPTYTVARMDGDNLVTTLDAGLSLDDAKALAFDQPEHEAINFGEEVLRPHNPDLFLPELRQFDPTELTAMDADSAIETLENMGFVDVSGEEEETLVPEMPEDFLNDRLAVAINEWSDEWGGIGDISTDSIDFDHLTDDDPSVVEGWIANWGIEDEESYPSLQDYLRNARTDAASEWAARHQKRLKVFESGDQRVYVQISQNEVKSVAVSIDGVATESLEEYRQRLEGYVALGKIPEDLDPANSPNMEVANSAVRQLMYDMAVGKTNGMTRAKLDEINEYRPSVIEPPELTEFGISIPNLGGVLVETNAGFSGLIPRTTLEDERSTGYNIPRAAVDSEWFDKSPRLVPEESPTMYKRNTTFGLALHEAITKHVIEEMEDNGIDVYGDYAPLLIPEAADVARVASEYLMSSHFVYNQPTASQVTVTGSPNNIPTEHLLKVLLPMAEVERYADTTFYNFYLPDLIDENGQITDDYMIAMSALRARSGLAAFVANGAHTDRMARDAVYEAGVHRFQVIENIPDEDEAQVNIISDVLDPEIDDPDWSKAVTELAAMDDADLLDVLTTHLGEESARATLKSITIGPTLNAADGSAWDNPQAQFPTLPASFAGRSAPDVDLAEARWVKIGGDWYVRSVYRDMVETAREAFDTLGYDEETRIRLPKLGDDAWVRVSRVDPFTGRATQGAEILTTTEMRELGEVEETYVDELGRVEGRDALQLLADIVNQAKESNPTNDVSALFDDDVVDDVGMAPIESILRDDVLRSRPDKYVSSGGGDVFVVQGTDLGTIYDVNEVIVDQLETTMRNVITEYVIEQADDDVIVAPLSPELGVLKAEMDSLAKGIELPLWDEIEMVSQDLDSITQRLATVRKQSVPVFTSGGVFVDGVLHVDADRTEAKVVAELDDLVQDRLLAAGAVRVTNSQDLNDYFEYSGSGDIYPGHMLMLTEPLQADEVKSLLEEYGLLEAYEQRFGLISSASPVDFETQIRSLTFDMTLLPRFQSSFGRTGVFRDLEYVNDEIRRLHRSADWEEDEWETEIEMFLTGQVFDDPTNETVANAGFDYWASPQSISRPQMVEGRYLAQGDTLLDKNGHLVVIQNIDYRDDRVVLEVAPVDDSVEAFQLEMWGAPNSSPADADGFSTSGNSATVTVYGGMFQVLMARDRRQPLIPISPSRMDKLVGTNKRIEYVEYDQRGDRDTDDNGLTTGAPTSQRGQFRLVGYEPEEAFEVLERFGFVHKIEDEIPSSILPRAGVGRYIPLHAPVVRGEEEIHIPKKPVSHGLTNRNDVETIAQSGSLMAISERIRRGVQPKGASGSETTSPKGDVRSGIDTSVFSLRGISSWGNIKIIYHDWVYLRRDLILSFEDYGGQPSRYQAYTAYHNLIRRDAKIPPANLFEPLPMAAREAHMDRTPGIGSAEFNPQHEVPVEDWRAVIVPTARDAESVRRYLLDLLMEGVITEMPAVVVRGENGAQTLKRLGYDRR